MVESPCIGICKLKDGVCIGCYRKSNEVRDWYKYNDKQKTKVLERIEKVKPKQ